MRLLTAAFLTLAVFALPALAQEGMDDDMGMPGMAMNNADSATPASKAFMDANMKMHKDMSIKFSGDTDTDFVRGMIPHHQGAIDMARVELHYGTDPALKKLASDIIAAQTTEITMMKEWLAKHGK